MSKYSVTVEAILYVKVEAETEEEAIQKVEEAGLYFNRPSLDIWDEGIEAVGVDEWLDEEDCSCPECAEVSA